MEHNTDKDNYPNLNRSNKWLGIIDYKALIILLVLMYIIWNGLGLVLTNQIYRLYILIILLIPFVGLLYANKSQENLWNVIYAVAKYLLSPKLYVYNIESNKPWLK